MLSLYLRGTDDWRREPVWGPACLRQMGGRLSHFTGEHAQGPGWPPDVPGWPRGARKGQRNPCSSAASSVPSHPGRALSLPGMLFPHASHEAPSQPLGPSREVTSSKKPSLAPLAMVASLLTLFQVLQTTRHHPKLSCRSAW